MRVSDQNYIQYNFIKVSIEKKGKNCNKLLLNGG